LNKAHSYSLWSLIIFPMKMGTPVRNPRK
jgi:hypothetical protein